MLGLFDVGAIGILLIILILVCLPLLLTIIVGMAFADTLHFTGIYWWSFVILFYIITTGIIGAICH